MKKYCDLIRIKHWLKNMLLFLPLFFSGNFFNKNKLFLSFLSFLVFCFLSSIVYIINDLKDLEYDKKHPIKKNRPLANNTISKKNSYIVISIFFLILCTLITYLYFRINNILSIIIPLCYLLINICYSFKLKNIPILDIIIIVLGFTLRVIYGGITTNILISKYLYLLVIFGSFYLAFGKRRGEINNNNYNSREVLKKYNKDFLNHNMYVSYTIALVSYILWCCDKNVILKNGHDYMFWTIPLLMIIFQTYSLDIDNNSYADPVEVVLNNKLLICLIIIYVILMVILIYIV